LEAAVECLAEHGWTGATVSVVAERAGVSRGAAQYHFPTREDLVAASVEYMTETWVHEIRQEASKLPTDHSRTEAIVDMIVRHYTGPHFRAALQLWVTASADESLREQMIPLEADIGRTAHEVVVELLDVDESVPGVRETVQATLDMARGLALADVLTDDSKRRTRIVRRWAHILDIVLEWRDTP